jgi:hypothetical protein
MSCTRATSEKVISKGGMPSATATVVGPLCQVNGNWNPPCRPSQPPQKAPRLDPNLLFEQMKAHEGKLTEAETILNEAVQAKADADLANNNLIDDVTNSCISKTLLVLSALISHQKGLSSSFVDFCKENFSVANSKKGKTLYPNWVADQQQQEQPGSRSGTFS